VTGLYLEPGQAGFDQLAASPFLARLREIDFPERSLPRGGLAQVAGRLSSLRKLEVNGWGATLAELDVFVRASWPHLKHLLFHRCGLDDPALGLLASMRAPQLECLRLVSERFGPRGLASLLDAPWLSQLTQLDLTQMGQALTPEALQALTHTPQLTNLRSLNLSHNRLGAEGLAVLADSPHLGQVRRLDLSYTEGGARGLIALFNSAILAGVRDLSYSSNGINFQEVDGGKVTPWPCLRRLSINPLSDHDLSWLLDRSLLDTVRHLWLFLAGLTGAGFLALLRSRLPRSLVGLSLSHNHLGSLDGLPSALDFPRLRWLELDSCRLGDQGAVRLIRALRAPNLRQLSLYQNELSNETVQAITSNPSLRHLEELSLSFHPGIDDEGARLFCESPLLERLDQLQVLDTGVSDSALAQLRRRFRRVRR
jgi:hypothetical protein